MGHIKIGHNFTKSQKMPLIKVVHLSKKLILKKITFILHGQGFYIFKCLSFFHKKVTFWGNCTISTKNVPDTSQSCKKNGPCITESKVIITKSCGQLLSWTIIIHFWLQRFFEASALCFWIIVHTVLGLQCPKKCQFFFCLWRK